MDPRADTTPPLGFYGTCERYPWACAPARNSSLSGADVIRLVKRVNTSVNNRVRGISDPRQYGRDEYWRLPTVRGGDCEDFALLKKRELIRLGVDPSKLLIATALDRQGRGHAVLIFRTSNGDFVLDNLTNRIRHWEKTGYTFLKLQDPDNPSEWVAILAGGLFSRVP